MNIHVKSLNIQQILALSLLNYCLIFKDFNLVQPFFYVNILLHFGIVRCPYRMVLNWVIVLKSTGTFELEDATWLV